MSTKYEFQENMDVAWCPGCGNFMILKTLKQTLNDLDIDQQKVVFASGIGQAAKMPQYLKVHYFNGLHGRALPVATAIKASNPGLTVFAEGGDGDMYGEGGNHFIHTIRRNIDLVNIVHNNMVYGLTKGQASPTSQRGFKTPLQINGVHLEPANPIGVALSYGATFIARAYSNDREQLQDILTQAVKHKGYALVDVFHPCVSFNKVNTHKWFKDNTYYLDDSHDVTDKEAAFKKSLENEHLPLGVFYKEEGNKTFNDYLEAYWDSKAPLHERKPDLNKLQEFVNNL
jgi:2-oxoglutarate ferredoxin oxidoreductase subunit beta